MTAVNASRTAPLTLTWSACVLRYPMVSTRWSSSMSVLCNGDASAAPPRGMGAVIIEVRPEGDDQAAVMLHLEQPDGAVRVAETLTARIQWSFDAHGMVHFDLTGVGVGDDALLALSLDLEAPHRLHYARTTLLSRLGLAAGSTDAPELASFECSVSTGA